jgi:hypothetical protein
LDLDDSSVSDASEKAEYFVNAIGPIESFKIGATHAFAKALRISLTDATRHQQLDALRGRFTLDVCKMAYEQAQGSESFERTRRRKVLRPHESRTESRGDRLPMVGEVDL